MTKPKAVQGQRLLMDEGLAKSQTTWGAEGTRPDSVCFCLVPSITEGLQWMRYEVHRGKLCMASPHKIPTNSLLPPTQTQ